MIRRALLAALALAAGCYQPSYDAAPFSCASGACPSGYQCRAALCIADGAPDPPVEIAESATASDSAAPQPVPYQGGFGVFYLADFGGGAPPGVYFRAALDVSSTRRVVDGSPTLSALSDVAFSVRYHPAMDLYGLAFRVNDPDSGDHLEVHLLSGDLAQDQLLPSSRSSPSALGFGAPSITLRTDANVPCNNAIIVAYSFGDLGTYSRDNLFCDQLVATGCGADALDGSFCYPDAGAMGQPFTSGSFVEEVAALDDGQELLLFWRELGGVYTHLDSRPHDRPSGFGETSTGVVLGSKVSHVLRGAFYPAAQQALRYAVVAAAPDAGPWQVVVGARAPPNAPLGFPSAIVPDVVADPDRQRFALCALDPSGEIAITVVPESGAPPPPIRVPRYSDAPIASCRLALSPGGALGVTWQELSAPAYRTYFTTVALP